EGPRAVFPRFIAELARFGNGVEGPKQLSALRVEPAHEAFGVVPRDNRHALFKGRPDDDGVFHHQWSGVQSNLTGFKVDLCSGAVDHSFFEIQNSAFSEARHWLPGLGVQLNKPISGGDEYDAVIALAVSPVRDAAARKLAWRNSCPLSFP